MQITKDSSDKEILDYPLDKSGNIVRNMGSISFMAWVAKKIDGAPAYKGATQEILLRVANPTLGKMSEGEKIQIIRKLLELNITV